MSLVTKNKTWKTMLVLMTDLYNVNLFELQ